MPWTSRSRGPGHGVIERCIRVDSRNCRRAHKCWRLQDNQYFPCYCDQMPKESNRREVILAHGTRDSVHGKNGGRDARRLLTVRLRLPAVRQWRESNPALDSLSSSLQVSSPWDDSTCIKLGFPMLLNLSGNTFRHSPRGVSSLEF